MMIMKTPAKPHMSDVQIEYNHLYKEFDDIYHDAALNASLSDSAFDILYGIFELGDGCLQRDICRTSCIPKQTINSAIRKMEQKELLYLTPGDGRNTVVFLTEKGKELMEKTIYPIIQIENDIYNSWTPEEQETFLRLNRDFAERLRDKVRKL